MVVPALGAYLECESGADFVRQDLCDDSVKGREDLHSQLGLNAAFVDQIVKGICQGQAETKQSKSALMPPHSD